ncbi:MAG: LPXTG cell wall anchor domain-containing protein [Eubacterium sp.]|uniref:LPXTG cell wall anchor domain-containing protein n=1 Tax=Eubacterium sp. TaxID=142586 RepID=UPI00300F3365
MVETMAPSGYKKLLEPIEIVVNAASGIYTITADKTEITTDIEKENGYKKVTVENKKGATLPTAGGMGTALFVAGGLIIMLGAATGVYVIRRKTVKER